MVLFPQSLIQFGKLTNSTCGSSPMLAIPYLNMATLTMTWLPLSFLMLFKATWQVIDRPDLFAHFIGGIVYIALDLFGLREYVKLNPDVRNLDILYTLLVESEVIPEELIDRCEIEFSLTSRNLQVVLSSRTSDDEEFCSIASERVAEVIDNPQQIIHYLPDSLQFATAAVAGPFVPASAMGVALHSSLMICALVLSTIIALF